MSLTAIDYQGVIAEFVFCQIVCVKLFRTIFALTKPQITNDYDTRYPRRYSWRNNYSNSPQIVKPPYYERTAHY